MRMMTSHNNDMRNKLNPNATTKLQFLLNVVPLIASDVTCAMLNDVLLLTMADAASLEFFAPKAI